MLDLQVESFWLCLLGDARSGSPDARQSLWNRIPNLEQVSSIQGAVPFTTGQGRHFIVVFALVIDKKIFGSKLQVIKLDLDRLSWGFKQWRMG